MSNSKSLSMTYGLARMAFAGQCAKTWASSTRKTNGPRNAAPTAGHAHLAGLWPHLAIQYRRSSAIQDYGTACRISHSSLLACSATHGVRRWTPVYVDE